MNINRSLERPHVFLPSPLGVASSPTLLLLHGTGADENDLIGLGQKLLPSASLLSPRGMYLENGINRFFERFPDGSFNETSIDEAVDDLAAFLKEACSSYSLDAQRVIGVGFSNGANTASALIMSHPDLLHGAVLFGSTRPFVSRPINSPLTGKRIWLANGDSDPYAPLSRSVSWVSEIAEAGAEVKFLRHSGGHQISLAHIQEISRDLA